MIQTSNHKFIKCQLPWWCLTHIRNSVKIDLNKSVHHILNVEVTPSEIHVFKFLVKVVFCFSIFPSNTGLLSAWFCWNCAIMRHLFCWCLLFFMHYTKRLSLYISSPLCLLWFPNRLASSRSTAVSAFGKVLQFCGNPFIIREAKLDHIKLRVGKGPVFHGLRQEAFSENK